MGLLNRIFEKEYHPLNLVEIKSGQILKNFDYLLKINRKISVAPVLKSNAYGHGIWKVGKILEACDAPFFCVDSLYEAYELYKARIKKPVLVMGYIDPRNLKVKQLPFAYAVSDFDQLEAISRFQKDATIHVKVDTGMHRLGIPMSDLPKLVEKLKTLKNIRIEGLLSHFAAGDTMNALTKKQISNFEKASDILKSAHIEPRWKHISATDGLLNLDVSLLCRISNLARLGLGLYGIDISGKHKSLIPALELSSKIVQIKTVESGESVGYGSSYRAGKRMLIGVLPIGYNDGVDRRLSNGGWVKIGERFCKIVGMVSMNITTVDLSPAIKPAIGQKVVVYSCGSADRNSIAKSAVICKTIPYDLLVHLSPTSIKRETV